MTRQRRPWTGQTITVAGMRFAVASPAEAEAGEFYVCTLITTPLLMADNLTGHCCKCGDALQFRPHAPVKPRKICIDCVTIEMNRRNATEQARARTRP